MKKDKQPEVWKLVQDELIALKGAGCSNVTLEALGKQCIDDLMDKPKTLEPAFKAANADTDEAKRKYIISEIIAHEEDIRNVSERTDFEDGSSETKTVRKFGNKMSEADLRAAFEQDAAIEFPEELLLDSKNSKSISDKYKHLYVTAHNKLPGVSQMTVEDVGARNSSDQSAQDKENKDAAAAEAEADANGDGKGSGGQSGKGKKQSDGKGEDGDEAEDVKAREAVRDAMRKQLHELLVTGKITNAEYNDARAAIAAQGLFQETNAAVKSLSDVASYMSKSKDGTLKTWWVGRSFKKERDRHAKLAAEMLGNYNDIQELINDRVRGGPLDGKKGRKGIFSGLQDKMSGHGSGSGRMEGERGSDEPEASKAKGGTLKKKAGKAFAIGTAIAVGTFKRFHPIAWIKNTYQGIREDLGLARTDNKNPENAKDPETVKAQHADMVSEPESKTVSKEAGKFIEANAEMTLEAMAQTPEGRDRMVQALMSTESGKAAVEKIAESSPAIQAQMIELMKSMQETMLKQSELMVKMAERMESGPQAEEAVATAEQQAADREAAVAEELRKKAKEEKAEKENGGTGNPKTGDEKTETGGQKTGTGDEKTETGDEKTGDEKTETGDEKTGDEKTETGDEKTGDEKTETGDEKTGESSDEETIDENEQTKNKNDTGMSVEDMDDFLEDMAGGSGDTHTEDEEAVPVVPTKAGTEPESNPVKQTVEAGAQILSDGTGEKKKIKLSAVEAVSASVEATDAAETAKNQNQNENGGLGS